MIFTFKFQGKPYAFDDMKMSLGEARWSKAETGFVGAEFFHAVQKADPDALSCIVVMAMRRAGLSEATLDSIADEENGYVEIMSTMDMIDPDDKPKPEKRVLANRADRRRNGTKAKENGAGTDVATVTEIKDQPVPG